MSQSLTPNLTPNALELLDFNYDDMNIESQQIVIDDSPDVSVKEQVLKVTKQSQIDFQIEISDDNSDSKSHKSNKPSNDNEKTVNKAKSKEKEKKVNGLNLKKVIDKKQSIRNTEKKKVKRGKNTYMIIKAPFKETMNDNVEDEYIYYSSTNHIDDPLWIAKVNRHYKKYGFADMIFFKSNGKNILDSDPCFEITNQEYRVYNIKESCVKIIKSHNLEKEIMRDVM